MNENQQDESMPDLTNLLPAEAILLNFGINPVSIKLQPDRETNPLRPYFNQLGLLAVAVVNSGGDIGD